VITPAGRSRGHTYGYNPPYKFSKSISRYFNISTHGGRERGIGSSPHDEDEAGCHAKHFRRVHLAMGGKDIFMPPVYFIRRFFIQTNSRGAMKMTLPPMARSIAISIAVGTFNPLDTLRIRWQVTSAASTGAADLHGSSCMNFGRKIVTQEGLLKGLWTPGLGANMTSFFICGGFRQGPARCTA
jgi:hypothetical protein